MYALLLFYVIIIIYFCQFLYIALRLLLILSVNSGSTDRYYIFYPFQRVSSHTPYSNDIKAIF